VIALLGPSNLDYIATVAGLHRLGYACLLLSTRLSTEAYVNLLRKTNSRSIIVASNYKSALESVKQQLPIDSYRIPDQSTYDLPVLSGPRFEPPPLSENAAHRTAFIIHSSGSTGLPKPIFQTHRACLVNYSSGAGYRAFLTLPLYHNHGISTFFRGIFSGNTTFFFNANLPLTGPNLLEAMKAAQPQSWHGVPYGLKLLGETEEGVAALARCNLVLYGGSSCPDELGDRLVNAGVYLVGHYGA
jgi:acyl-CoA synthetase (AMP-forming)/AMP-acid ligase II